MSSAENAKTLFSAFDIDNSGTIEEDEFLVGFCVFTNSSPSSTARFMFHAMDDDGNGTVEKAELADYMTQMVQMLGVLFPMIMEFQELKGNEETKAAMRHARALLTKKGEVWLKRKEQSIQYECNEIFKLCKKDSAGRVTEKAWLEAFRKATNDIKIYLELPPTH